MARWQTSYSDTYAARADYHLSFVARHLSRKSLERSPSWMFWTAAPSEQRKMASLFARYSASHSSVVACGKPAFQRGSPRTKMIAMVLAK